MSSPIAIVAGTGKVGLGLTLRWAQAGERVLLASRELARAEAAAEEVRQRLPRSHVEPRTYADAVREAEMVVLSVPLAARIGILKSLREVWRPGAVLVDTTVPLEKTVGGRLSHILPLWEGSAGQQAARYAGKQVRVTAAFHSVSAASLQDLDQDVDSDVLIVGDDAEARSLVAAWVRKIAGARPVDGGPLENARYAEHLAALLISLNLRHKIPSSGVRFTGLPGFGDEA
jgi:NADPH-dependent F420 reductase